MQYMLTPLVVMELLSIENSEDCCTSSVESRKKTPTLDDVANVDDVVVRIVDPLTTNKLRPRIVMVLALRPAMPYVPA